MHPSTRPLAAAVLAATLAGCGGGGGGSTQSPASSTVSTALAAQPRPPSGFEFPGFRALPPIASTQLTSDVSRFADPARTWVSLWHDAADGSRSQLAFLPLATLRALDARGGLRLSVPVGAGPVRFEVWDRTQRIEGQVAP